MTHEPECANYGEDTLAWPCVCDVARSAYQRGREDASRAVMSTEMRRCTHWLADHSGSWTCVPVDAAAHQAREGSGESNG